MGKEYLGDPKNDVVSAKKLSEQARGEVQRVDLEEIEGQGFHFAGRYVRLRWGIGFGSEGTTNWFGCLNR